MQKMSGLDLQFAVSEIARLQGKRIARIRKTDGGVYLFKIGGEEILFEPGVRLHLTRQSLAAAEKPDGFVGFLRKNFEGKTAVSISQVPKERIVEILAKSKERLVFELFREGNLIAVGEDGAIVACLQREEKGGRKITKGEKYAHPKATPFEIKAPQSVAFVVQENGRGEPVSFSADAAKGGKQFPAISDALDYYYANQKSESDAEKAASGKITGLEKRLKSQEESLVRMEQERLAAKATGDAIWASLEKFDALISMVKEMKKAGFGEKEINAGLAKHGARLDGAEIAVEA